MSRNSKGVLVDLLDLTNPKLSTKYLTTILHMPVEEFDVFR
jgi:hypothetical protein